MGGDVSILLQKSTGSRTDLKNDGSKVNFDAKQDLGNGLSALGYLSVKVNGDNFQGLEVNKLYAGLAQDGVGTITFGNQSTSGNDVALGNYTYKWGGNSPLTGSGDKVVKFRSAEFSGLSFGADYLFGYKEKVGGSGFKHGYGLSAFYTANFADNVTLNVNAGYTEGKNVLADITKSTKEFKEKWDSAGDINDLIDATKILANSSKSWLLTSEVNSGPVSVGLSYGQSKIKLNNTAVSSVAHRIDDSKVKVKAFLFGTNYKITDAAKVYAQYNRTSALGGHLNGYILGTGYKLHKNVETFVEVARFKPSGDKAENKLGVGFRVNF